MAYFIFILINLIVQWESATSVSEHVELDEFQNVYAYDATTIDKFDKSGTNHFTFSTLRKGDLTNLDVTNPLRLVLYFGENNEVLFLDNTLTEQGNSMNFNDLEFYDVGMVCSSFQNHLWIYRVAEQKLVRLSRNGMVVNETGNLALWLDRNEQSSFTLLKESGNYLYLVSEEGLVMVFDHYGTYIKKYNLGAYDQLHFMDKFILIKRGMHIYSLNVDFLEEQKLYEIPGRFNQAAAMDFTPTSLAVIQGKKVSFLKALK